MFEGKSIVLYSLQKVEMVERHCPTEKAKKKRKLFRIKRSRTVSQQGNNNQMVFSPSIGDGTHVLCAVNAMDIGTGYAKRYKSSS